MAADTGRDFVLKQGTASGGTAIGAFRTTNLTINNQLVDITTKTAGRNRTLLSAGGITSMSISGEGVFEDAAVEYTVLGYATAGTNNAFGIVLPNGDYVDGSWQVSSYTRTGNYDDAETFSITLESSGAVTYTAN